MARIFGDNELSSMYQNKADQLKQKINADWWDADNHCYFDFISTKDKALKIIDMALDKRVQSGRNEWAGNYLKKLKQSVADGSYTKNGYTVFFNPSTVVLNTQVADSSKAIDYLNHVVRKGENINSIAHRYGVSVSSIRRWNRLRSNKLARGRRLILKVEVNDTQLAENNTPEKNTKAEKKATPVSSKYKTLARYKVRSGDSLYSISKRYHGVSPEALRKANKLSDSSIRPGQVLKIPVV